ncbi:MAG: hypothetical protein NUV68_02140 [Caldiserica bacterium]|jgi:dihydroorotate dehydrogenase electron transfer subunit|nr:hypothetical protein [Caldisericota bacterium]MDH7562158.1 hypothetical protein [Caldisericota bacterium]
MSGVFKARILKKASLAGEIFHLVMEIDSPLGSAPGQFIRLSLPGVLDPFLPRPFLVFKEMGTLVEIVFYPRGKFTRILSEVEEGMFLQLQGPLGKPFVLPDAKSYLLVGGGTGGVFFSRYLETLKSKRHLFLLGSRSLSTNWFPLVFPQKETFLVTEDGSSGIKGTVIDPLPQLIDDFTPDLIIASGPISLLKKVKSVSEIRGVPLYLVLEEIMGCGVGVCLSCAISLKGERGLKRVRLCREGLVWNASEVILPES